MACIVAHLPLGYRLFEEINYQSNTELMDEMTAVADPSYNKTRSLLEWEFAHNHSVYFIRNKGQELVGDSRYPPGEGEGTCLRNPIFQRRES